MTLHEIRSIAVKRGLHLWHVKKMEMIREIQKDEGNTECFATDKDGQCDQVNCLWRQDCMRYH